jgi:hypothetical protein
VVRGVFGDPKVRIVTLKRRSKKHCVDAVAVSRWDGTTARSGRCVTCPERHWDGIAAYCRPENKVSLGFVEGLNNKIRVIQRRAYGLKNEQYFRLKVLSCMLPEL